MAVQFVKPEVIPFGPAPAEENRALKMVELCGRTAYKSEDRITDDSAKAFVLTLKKLGHLSVLEHSNIVLRISGSAPPSGGLAGGGMLLWQDLIGVLRERNGFHRVVPLSNTAAHDCVVAGNFRSWIETLVWLRDRHADYWRFFSHNLHRFFPSLFPVDETPPATLNHRVELLTEEQQLAMLRQDASCDLPVFIFKFICDRGITHEVVRHRVFSFTQESTRYVNYQNRGMTLVLPEELQPFFDTARGELTEDEPVAAIWLARAKTLFEWYQADLERGLKPEIARDILPNLLKSEIFVTGRWSGWEHFIRLRDSKKAHLRIREIAREVRQYFDSMGMIVGSQEE
jgi:flavin-dependent thymidylate synthase